MENKKVAGTVMLNMQDGDKRFLVHSTGEAVELASTDFAQDKTGLANILGMLKEQVHLDVKKIDLVELTNGQIDDENVPLFVFEAQEALLESQLPEDFSWEEPQRFQKIISNYQIEGMPFF